MRKTLLLLVLLAILLAACGTGFNKSGTTYVFTTWDEMNGKVEHLVVGADAATFEVFDGDGYARDKGQVYFQWNAIAGADPASFKALNRLYGKDAAHVYYEGKQVPGADPASFALFNLQWGRDAGEVYFQDRPVNACDPASFKLLKDDWQIDDQCAYREGTRLEGSDPATFTVLNYWFAKDSRQVYSILRKPIPGADAATFKLQDGICQVCAQDKNTCYRYEEAVPCESRP
jgi:hypothetical protein